MISSILCPIHEEILGPAMPDPTGLAEGRLRLPGYRRPTDPTRLTLTTYAGELAHLCSERATRDAHLRYLDGATVPRGGRGRPDAARRARPEASTHQRIGQRFAERASVTVDPSLTGTATNGGAVPRGSAITLAASYSVSIGVSGPTLRW